MLGVMQLVVTKEIGQNTANTSYECYIELSEPRIGG
jgi:hypothetical protein